MTTALDLDLATLVGELEDVACEHSQHGESPSHTDGPASHYLRYQHECGYSKMYAACPGFVARVIWLAATGGELGCRGCHQGALCAETTTILGPVNGRSS